MKCLDRKETERKEWEWEYMPAYKDNFYEFFLDLLTPTYNLPFSATGLFLVGNMSECRE